MNAPKRVLVAYYSLTGNTARVARDLAARLGADIESIEDTDHGTGALAKFAAAFDAWRKAPAKIGALQYDPVEYAITIVGTPVWVGQMTPAARAYLNGTKGRAQSIAFFVTSGNTDVKRIAPSLEMAAGQNAVASAGLNASELRDPATYERKLSAFVGEITNASKSAQRVA